MLKAFKHQLGNKYKTKGTVESEHLGGRPMKSTLHTDLTITRHVKT